MRVFQVVRRLSGIFIGGFFVENKIAMIGIVIEENKRAEKVNGILHEYSKFIVGRMGMPYSKRNISIISVIFDAPNDVISSVSGKLGMLPDVHAKVMYYKSK